MAGTLWKFSSLKRNGKLLKGMSAEVITKGPKPTQQEIADALNRKYNTEIHSSHCGRLNFKWDN